MHQQVPCVSSSSSARRRSSRLNDPSSCARISTAQLPFRVQSLFRDVDISNPKALKRLRSNIPHNYELLNCNPNVYLIHKFLTEKETAHLINLSKEEESKFKSSFTEDTDNRKVISSERTSKYMTISPSSSDIIVRRIVQKASNCMGYFNDNVEPLQIVRYSRGQYFNLHHDAGTLNDEEGCIEAVSPKRVLTFFVYLNDCPSGEGHTAFPSISSSNSSSNHSNEKTTDTSIAGSSAAKSTDAAGPIEVPMPVPVTKSQSPEAEAATALHYHHLVQNQQSGALDPLLGAEDNYYNVSNETDPNDADPVIEIKRELNNLISIFPDGMHADSSSSSNSSSTVKGTEKTNSSDNKCSVRAKGSDHGLESPRSPLTPQQLRRVARQGGLKPSRILDEFTDISSTTAAVVDVDAVKTEGKLIEHSPTAAAAGVSSEADSVRLSEILSVQPKAGCALLFCNFYIPAYDQGARRNDGEEDDSEVVEGEEEADTAGGGDRESVATTTTREVQYIASDSALYPLLPGCPDPRTIHSATPVYSKGVTKYGMNIWVTDEHAFNHTQGLKDTNKGGNKCCKSKGKGSKGDRAKPGLVNNDGSVGGMTGTGAAFSTQALPHELKRGRGRPRKQPQQPQQHQPSVAAPESTHIPAVPAVHQFTVTALPQSPPPSQLQSLKQPVSRVGTSASTLSVFETLPAPTHLQMPMHSASASTSKHES